MVGRYFAMCKFSRIFLLNSFFGADAMIVQVNVWSGCASRCFAGSDLVEGVLCSVHRMAAFLSVSPMYFLLHVVHVPS